MTNTTTVRIPDDLKAEGEAAARDLRISFSDVTRNALAEYLGKEPRRAAGKQSVIRALEAENASLKVQLEAALAALGRATATPTVPAVTVPGRSRSRSFAPAGAYAVAEKLFAARLAAADAGNPATPVFLSMATGRDRNWNMRRLQALVGTGHAVKLRKGEYIPAEGATEAGILAALAGVHGQLVELVAAAARDARDARERSEAPASPPAPRVPAAAATAARNGRIARARDKAAAAGAPLVAASDLPRPGAAVFQPAGEDKTVTAVPEVTAGKPRGPRRTRCPHRLPAGAWCKTCQQPK